MARTLPERSRAVPGVAAAVTIGLLALAGRYGPHRDELYFIAAGHHPQAGYPDQPPLTPLIAGAADQLAPGSLLALRLVPALLIGGVVLLVADLARELGGDRRAQVLAAITVAVGAGPLIAGHLLSTATLDLFFGTVVVRLVVGILNRDAPRGWLWVGLAAGIGLENKTLVAPLLAGLGLGIVLTPSLRGHLRSPWLWAGAVIAVVLWAPNLWWQAENGWPQLTLAADIRDEYGTAGGLVQLLVLQLVLLNLLGAFLAAKGLRPGPIPSAARPIAIAYLVLLAFFAVTGGKGYYLIELLVALVAVGSVVAADRWSPSGPAWFAGAVVVTALLTVPAVLPVLPVSTFSGSFYRTLGEDGMETIGWPRVVAQVRDAVASLPADQRRRAVVVTENYGEAGALLRYGGTPPVYSGHNGFGDWGPPPAGAGPVLYVGDQAPAALTGCRRVAKLDTGVDNEENGNSIWLCAAPASWPQTWKGLRHLSA